VDAKAFYMFKDFLAISCNTEDSYWRLFLDFWVRTIVTDSDSILLLVMSFIPAYLFKHAIVLVLQPIGAVVFGLLFTIIASVENRLPSSSTPLQKLAQKVKKLNVIDFSKADCNCDCPPLTHRRERRDKNYVEYLWYEQNRVFRDFAHFSATTSLLLEAMITQPMVLMLKLRILCLVVPLGSMIRHITMLIPPVAPMVEMHQDWFRQSSRNGYADSLLHSALHSVLAWIEPFLGFAITTGAATGSAAVGIANATLDYAAIYAIYAGPPLFVVGLFYFCYSYQSWKFDRQWDGNHQFRGGLSANEFPECGETCCQCSCIKALECRICDPAHENGESQDAEGDKENRIAENTDQDIGGKYL
jgi:hypothetical protein